MSFFLLLKQQREGSITCDNESHLAFIKRILLQFLGYFLTQRLADFSVTFSSHILDYFIALLNPITPSQIVGVTNILTLKAKCYTVYLANDDSLLLGLSSLCVAWLPLQSYGRKGWSCIEYNGKKVWALSDTFLLHL
jgi:hypothetical protein